MTFFHRGVPVKIFLVLISFLIRFVSRARDDSQIPRVVVQIVVVKSEQSLQRAILHLLLGHLRKSHERRRGAMIISLDSIAATERSRQMFLKHETFFRFFVGEGIANENSRSAHSLCFS